MKELIEIQSELKAPKNQNNAFGKYKYRSCEDILEAVKPLLKKYNCTLYMTDEAIEVGGKIFIQANVKLKKNDECIMVSSLAMHSDKQAGMSDSQITGSASSYARKYALNGLFLIDDTKDADTEEQHEEKEAKQEDSKPWLNPKDDAWKGAIAKGSTLAQLFPYFKISKDNQAEYTNQLNEKK
jgi:hypothetical protein